MKQWSSRLLRRFGRDERGFVLVFAAVLIPALLGFVGLAVDGARLMTLDTQLAAVADAAALAAANRLDRTDGAISAARAAAEALANGAAFSRRNRDTPRLTLRFAETLVDLRTDPGYSLPETEAAKAVFVEATTGAYTLTTSLLQVFASPIRRRAVAEAQSYACDVTPLVLCQADPDRFAATARPGRQYLVRMDGNLVDGSVVPLDKPDDEGTRTTLRNLASDAPAFCYADALALRRNIPQAEFDDAINIRFDRYFNGLAAVASDLAVFPPAPIVIQGRHLNACSSPPSGGDVNPPYHLPRDVAYRIVRPSSTYDQGLGDWAVSAAYGGMPGVQTTRAIDEYILWNHADKDSGFQDSLREAATRYEIYLRELGLTRETETVPVVTRGNALMGRTMPTGGPLTGPLAFVRESPVPICYPGTRPATQARRRVLYLSVADCRDIATAGAARLSRHVAKVFLTEPASGGGLLVELVAMLTPRDDDGKLRRVVQLVETR
ncbi:pilus assembly protein TadG-related protein [Methylobacterium sp. Leaf108]|uniref:TadE/TadG family type IV pilus assembly protein n=1 Tax=Methylobacterium sp. Leaf108 TaxID=1736256 RepID=UPI0006F4CCDE|nr:pilus assembly protein TadG-related protein [Methylobacterium sp. Leaf108]KQP53666.1 hypothetical protein ASF39_19865 [Methylobacterium sp. Leaf108]